LRSRNLGHASLFLNFAIMVVLLVVIPHTKFEVCSFSRYRDIEGVPNFTSRSRDLVRPRPLYPLILHFGSIPCSHSTCQI